MVYTYSMGWLKGQFKRLKLKRGRTDPSDNGIRILVNVRVLNVHWYYCPIDNTSALLWKEILNTSDSLRGYRGVYGRCYVTDMEFVPRGELVHMIIFCMQV